MLKISRSTVYLIIVGKFLTQHTHNLIKETSTSHKECPQYLLIVISKLNLLASIHSCLCAVGGPG